MMVGGGTIHRPRAFRLVAVLWLTFLVHATSSSSSAPSKPHIIFILADDLGWNDVSWHNPQALSPNLEALARSGIILEQSYVQPICTPTRSALLTGRYPFTIGRQHSVIKALEPTGLLLNATLLPEALKQVGYDTHMVGKWHLGFCHWDYVPTSRGFDTFYGFYQGAQDHYQKTIDPDYRPGENTRQPADDYPYGYDFRNNTEPDLSVEGTYDTYVYASYVENLLSSGNPETPMFLYLPFQSVHHPFQVPDKYREPFLYIGDENRENLLGMVSAMDEAVGRVVDALIASGHYNNSVIIFSSDNGGSVSAGNNWPLRGGKGSLWEGGTRGVGFIHSPLLPERGLVSHTMVHVTDWYKTIVGLAGGVAPEDTDGFDQWEAITTGAESPRSSFVYNIDKVTLEDNTTQINAAIRKGDFKLLVGDPGNGNWTPPPEGFDSSFHGIDNFEENEVRPHGNNGNVDIQIKVDSDWFTFGELEMDVDSLRLLKLSVDDQTPIMLYNVIDDPEERNDITESHQEVVEDMLFDLEKELSRLVPADVPPTDQAGDPENFHNVWTPGWCEAK